MPSVAEAGEPGRHHFAEAVLEQGQNTASARGCPGIRPDFCSVSHRTWSRPPEAKKDLYTYDASGRLTGLLYHQGDTVLASYAWTYSDSGSPFLLAEGQGVTAASPAPWSPNGGLPVIGSVGASQGMLPVHDTTGVVNALLSGSYGLSSQLTSCTSTDGTVTYTYDATGQLIGATYSDGQDDESYTYDLNGNRTNPGYVTGPDNQLLSDGTYWYTYDADGNRTSRFIWIDTDADSQIDADEESDITQYTWDNRNRLVQVTDRATLDSPATQIVTNYYDAENRWVGRAVDPDGDTGTAAIRLTSFAYAGNQIILQFDGTAETFPAPLGAEGEGLASSPRPLAGEGSGGEGSENQTEFSTPLTIENLSHRYLWADAVDQLLADEQLEATASGYDLSSPGNVVWPLADQLGTVRDLAVQDAVTGVTSVANHRQFDAYGNMVSQTNAAVDCLFGFTGRPWDESTGLQNNLNRWYDAKVGRWLSEDPIGFEAGDGNLSRYVRNNPILKRDHTGLTDWSKWPSWLPRNTPVEEIERMMKVAKAERLRELQCAKKILEQAKRLAGKSANIRPQGGCRCATPFNPLSAIFEFLDMWGRSNESGRSIWEEYDKEADDFMDEWKPGWRTRRPDEPPLVF